MGLEKKNGHMCRNFTYGFVKPNFDASVLAFCRYVGIFTTWSAHTLCGQKGWIANFLANANKLHSDTARVHSSDTAAN